MTEFRISPADLRRLAQIVEENGLSELRYEEGDLRITLRTALHPRPGNAPSAAAAVAPAPLSGVVALPATLEDPESDYPRVSASGGGLAGSGAVSSSPSSSATLSGAVVEAPVMGVFYRSPAPGAAPFVEVGDEVEAGQPVGLIEAMKVFSEVLSEVPGRVRECPVKSGALVQPGDPLVVLEKIS